MTISRRNLARAGIGAAWAASAGRIARAADDGPIRIGMVGPLSGPIAVLGGPIRMGMEITAQSINKAGGVRGRMIEPVFRDDRANPSETVGLVRELTSNNINLIFCGLLTAALYGATPVLVEANAVDITMGAVAMAITHEKYTRNIFHPNPTDYAQVNAYARFAAERFPDIDVWGFSSLDIPALVDSYALFVKLAQQRYAAIGRKPRFLDPVLFKIGGGDFRNQINTLNGQGLGGLFNLVYGQDNITYWQQARGLGFGPQLKAILDRGNEYPFAKAMKKNLPANYWTQLIWNPTLRASNPLSQFLYDETVARTGDANPGVYVHYGEYAVRAYVRAIELAEGRTDTDSIIRAMEGMSFDTANGVYTFRKEDHQGVIDVNIVRFAPAETEVGFAVLDSLRYPGQDLIEPPTPGKAFTL